jgi:hypothetical protein
MATRMFTAAPNIRRPAADLAKPDSVIIPANSQN